MLSLSHSACLLVCHSTQQQQKKGYGDFSPHNDASKMFTIFIGCLGIIILGILLGMLSEFFSERQQQRLDARMKNARIKVMEQVRFTIDILHIF